MARAPARPGPGLTSGGSGVRGAGRITVILFSLLIGGADFALGYVIKPLYGTSASSSSNSGTPATTVPSASPSASGSPAASPSASASPGASPSATPTG